VPPAPATTSLLKDINERTVLDHIRSGAPISRAEISRRAGISKPTVSVALERLLEAELVRETSAEGNGPSYGARFFEPVPDAAVVVGLDIGTRFVRGAVADLAGRSLAREDVAVEGRTATGLLDIAAGLQMRLLAAAGVDPDRLDRSVIGAPGVLDPASERLCLADTVGLDGVAIVAELEQRLAVPVHVENDINLAALGEQARGAGAGVDSFAFLSVGAGMGAGMILGGELHRGHRGAAGEVDYAFHGGQDSPVDPSAGALVAFAEAMLDEGRHPSSLRAPLDPPMLFLAAREGDRLARAAVAEEAFRIAAHIAAIAAVVDVELVVLGGGIGLNGDQLLDPIGTELARLLPFPPRVEVSTLGDAPVLAGALAVGLRHALESVFEGRHARAQRAKQRR